jgi:hypothetical protein
MTLTAPLSKLHTVRFHREIGVTVARCTCGWTMRGAKAEVYNRAAVHDLEQWPLTDDDLHATL